MLSIFRDYMKNQVIEQIEYYQCQNIPSATKLHVTACYNITAQDVNDALASGSNKTSIAHRIKNPLRSVGKTFWSPNKLTINLKYLISLKSFKFSCMKVLIKDSLFKTHYINLHCIFIVIRTHDSLHLIVIYCNFYPIAISHQMTKHVLPQLCLLSQVHFERSCENPNFQFVIVTMPFPTFFLR